MQANITIRFVGNEDIARRFLLQRQDGRYYTGRGWTDSLDNARLYDRLAAVVKTYHTLQNRKYRGQPQRKFRVRLDLTVSGSGRYAAHDLRRFLAAAMSVTLDTAAAGDGPSGTFVVAAPALWTLEEVYSDEACPAGTGTK